MADCELCGREDAYIHFGAEQICLFCYNEKMSEELGVQAESYPTGITIRDGKGQAHEFRLRKRLDPIGVIMEADEQGTGGYQFVADCELDGDQGALLLELIAKAERGMAEQYIEQRHVRTITNARLAGRVEWNPTDDEIPLLVVDGKTYSWQEIGKMVMSYEGFQLKLELLDSSDEIVWGK